MVVLEFQAVVLAAGRGTRLPELTGDRPKCLLPIGPFPLIWYPLHMLQKHGFLDAIVVVQESQKFEIQQALEKTPLKLKIEFACIPSDSDFGTADSLKHIQDRIKADVLIVSCDTITNVSLFPLLNMFRQHDASMAALFLKGGAEADTVVPGPKTKHKPERDLIGIHEDTQRLLFLASTSDFEESMSLPGHLLRKNGSVVIHSRLVDSHIYVIKKWIVDFLSKSEGFSTLKGELLPYIIKKQMSRPGIATSEFDKPFSMVNVNIKNDDIFNFVIASDLQSKITETSLYNDSNTQDAYHSDVIRCYATRAPDNIFGIRVNTTLGYCAANQKIFTYWEQLFGDSSVAPPPLIAPGATIKSTQMTQCAVGDNSTVLEKTSLKKCILGNNCQVNSKTRISDSVLMNGVIIEEGCVIDNSVICEKAVIKAGSVVKNCLIGPSYVVAEASNIEKVHLTNADGFMEIE